MNVFLKDKMLSFTKEIPIIQKTYEIPNNYEIENTGESFNTINLKKEFVNEFESKLNKIESQVPTAFCLNKLLKTIKIQSQTKKV